jgi:hypothetical protein
MAKLGITGAPSGQSDLFVSALRVVPPVGFVPGFVKAVSRGGR